MCYLQFVEKGFDHDIFSFHHNCISIVLMHNPSCFSLLCPTFIMDFCPMNPQIGNLRGSNFVPCTDVDSCFQLPKQTNDFLSPLTPQKAEEEGKGFVSHTTTKIEAW